MATLLLANTFWRKKVRRSFDCRQAMGRQLLDRTCTHACPAAAGRTSCSAGRRGPCGRRTCARAAATCAGGTEPPAPAQAPPAGSPPARRQSTAVSDFGSAADTQVDGAVPNCRHKASSVSMLSICELPYLPRGLAKCHLTTKCHVPLCLVLATAAQHSPESALSSAHSSPPRGGPARGNSPRAAASCASPRGRRSAGRACRWLPCTAGTPP